jgi:DNA sulfur modification protein DndE
MPTRIKITRLLTVAILAAGTAVVGNGQTSDQAQLAGLPSFADGVEAYIYGYPLVVMAMTERVVTTTPDATTKLGRAPINQFAKATMLPNASYTDVVLPSTTTLYASAFLNLTAEPIILHIPNIKNRFYLLQMLDAWTNVSPDSPGTRIGSTEGDYALVGPDWKDSLPSGISHTIRMPTNTMWIIGRLYASGTDADLHVVTDEIFPQLTLTPLSAYGHDYTAPEVPVNPSIDTSTTPVEQVANMDACAFFGTMAAMMTSNPPLEADMPTVERLAKIQIFPGKQFDCGALDANHPGLRPTLQLAAAAAKRILDGAPPPSLTPTNWSMPLNIGDYGRRYLLRALVAKKALGANSTADAVYGYTTHDSSGTATQDLLTGANKYVIHFNAPTAQKKAGEIPPVNPQSFWSVTIYNGDGTLVENKVVNYNAIGVPQVQAHDACFNSDGSLDLYLQVDPPSDSKQFCNWLPAPPGDFIVFLRMYWPDAAVTGGSWYPPGVQKVN